MAIGVASILIGHLIQTEKAMDKNLMARKIVARILYLAVFVSNMICIVAFIADPGSYIYSYQVAGAAGAVAAIEGYGVAFAMWNVTYPFFILNKNDNKALGLAIIVQQAVGLVGELYIKAGLGEDCAILADSITRFVWFDAGGLVLLVVGFTVLFFRNVTRDPFPQHTARFRINE